MTEQQTEVDVNARLREFVDAIQDSKQYQRFVEARERLDEDQEAQQLLRTFQEKQAQLQRGFDQETMAELQEIQDEMDDNEVISEYMEAESELISVLDRTNDVISDRIGEEFARSMGGGCC